MNGKMLAQAILLLVDGNTRKNGVDAESIFDVEVMHHRKFLSSKYKPFHN
jgi:hypothetical protein